MFLFACMCPYNLSRSSAKLPPNVQQHRIIVVAAAAVRSCWLAMMISLVVAARTVRMMTLAAQASAVLPCSTVCVTAAMTTKVVAVE